MYQSQKKQKAEITAGEFLRTLAPDFAWLTSFDLFLMYELIDEDYELPSFRTLLRQHVQRGIIERKLEENVSYGSRTKYLYKRRT